MTTTKFPVLIGDIGGTNARFQILADRASAPLDFEHIRTKKFETIEEAIAKSVLAKTDIKPVTAILAAAGPIKANGLDLTNCDWKIAPLSFLNFSSIEELILFNDFDAQALALPSLGPDHLVQIGGGDFTRENKLKAVAGPGTGLGVGLLVYANNVWVPVGGEGGHVDFGPRTERETQIWEHLERFDGRVSAESILCGPGLLNLYNAVCAVDGRAPKFIDPAEISKAAMQGDDPQAHETLSLFCCCLGRFAGDLAATVLPRGGFYIGGGIARQIEPFLKESDFRAAFEDKSPHVELMKSIPTLLIKSDVPALLGLASFAQNPNQFGVSLDHRSWIRA